MESKKVLGRVFEGPRSDRFHDVSPEAGQLYGRPLFFYTWGGIQFFWGAETKWPLVPSRPWVPYFKAGLRKENGLQ